MRPARAIMPARPNQETASAGTPAVRVLKKTGVGFELHAYDLGGPKGGIDHRAEPLVPSAGFMLFIERFLKADVLAKIGS